SRFWLIRSQIASGDFFHPLATLPMISAIALRAITIASRLLAEALRMRREVAGGQHLDEFARRRRQLAPALVDDRQRPRERSLLELEHLDRAARHLVLNRQAVNDG